MTTTRTSVPAHPALHIPAESWSWRFTTLLLLLVGAPQLVVAIAAPIGDPAAESAISDLAAYFVVLFCSVLTYFHWRISVDVGGAWLTVGLAVTGVQGLSLAGIRLLNPDGPTGHAGGVMVADLLLGLALLAIVILADRLAVHGDAMAAGIAVGFLVTGATYALASLDVQPPVGGALTFSAYILLLLAMYVAVGYAVYRMSCLPAWVAVRAGVAVVLLSASHFATYLDPTRATPSLMTWTTNILGGVMLCSIALALLRQSVVDGDRHLSEVSELLARATYDLRDYREKFHEVRGTVAGIASATNLINDESGLSSDDRGLLSAMVRVELPRLQRLVDSGTPAPPGCVNLDAAIRPLTVGQEALGQRVRWQPTGDLAFARCDDVAEALLILLRNAAQHAPWSTATVEVTRVGAAVEVRVSDTGPGIAPELRQHIFDWGVSGPGSDGEGIGLHVARRLVRENGGDLRLEDTETGASFVATLIAARTDHATRARSQK